MKLRTSIPPRKDGTMIATGHDGREYLFRLDETGELIGEVGDKENVVFLCGYDNGSQFWPASDSDQEQVAAAIMAAEADPDGPEEAYQFNADAAPDLGGAPAEPQAEPEAKPRKRGRPSKAEKAAREAAEQQ